ncbi:MAG: YfhO family protein [Candidatus Omnitrophica bacterium]|nr:YfhO family protein [Candidatus Omnitrophota bacterium]
MKFKKKTVCSFVLLLCVIALWLFIYRGGWLNGLRLKGDAGSYFESFSFIAGSFSNGVYPLWNPSYGHGIPNSFFLRRIGEFNPFYVILFALMKCGARFEAAYFIFLVAYMFLGLAGFYHVIKRIYRQEKYAFIGALLLTFSSFGSILFQSFIILIFTPAIWFFYFIISFYHKQSRINFIGALFCLLIICATYIPFYFLTLLMFFLLFQTVLYPHRVKNFARISTAFIVRESRLAFVAGLSLFLALGPGLFLFQNARSGLFVLPVRHHLSSENNSLSLRHQTTAVGGIPRVNLLKDGLLDLKNMHIGTIYIPVWVIVLLLLSGWIHLNRRIVLYVLWAATIYLLSIYDASFVYPVMYKYIFFFKWFRNFQFFIWIFLLPIIIILGIEHLYVFENEEEEGRKRRNKQIYLVIAHSGLFLFLILCHHYVLSSYLAILLSLLYFLFQDGYLKQKPASTRLVILLLIVIQPLAVSRYLNASMRTLPGAKLSYDLPEAFPYYEVSSLTDPDIKSPPIYIGTAWYDRLRQALPYATIKKYLQYKFIVYDQTSQIRLTPKTRSVILQAFDDHKNIAFIRESDGKSFLGQVKRVPPLLITRSSEQFHVLGYSANKVEVKTNFPGEKFVVYNDCYYPGWRVFVDGREVPLYRGNIAFKGVWVPAGPHRVLFAFGRPAVYFYYSGIFVLFYGWFFYLIWLIFLDARKGSHAD